MVNVNYKSDFKINEKPKGMVVDVPFVFSYYIFEKDRYEASFDGKTYKNCVRAEDGSIDVEYIVGIGVCGRRTH